MRFKYLTTNGLTLEAVWAWAKQLVETLNNASEAQLGAGMVVLWAGTNIPQGWLLCDGASYPITTQRTLFIAIGYTYGGSGDNFSVPNYTSPVAGARLIIKA
jgi:Phage Tail Collar Domain